MVEEEGNPSPPGVEGEAADLVEHPHFGVPVDDPADEANAFRLTKRSAEGPQEAFGGVPLAPLEAREKNEFSPGIPKAADAAVKIIRVDAERNRRDGEAKPGFQEPEPIEFRRHPDLVHLAGLPNGVLRDAVGRGHGVAYFDFGGIAAKRVGAPVNDADARSSCGLPRADQVHEVVAGRFRLGRGERRSGTVGVAIEDSNAFRIQALEDLAAAHRVGGRDVHAGSPQQPAGIAGFELHAPFLVEDLLARLKDSGEVRGVRLCRTVLVVNERDVSAEKNAKSGSLGAKTVVGIFEIRLEVFRQGPEDI